MTEKMRNDIINRLEAFQQKEKFAEDLSIFYPGISDISMQEPLSEIINSVANEFKNFVLTQRTTDKDLLQVIQGGLQSFKSVYINLDTEDRERICLYMEELMDIVGLESSGGTLNQFMYGWNFPLGEGSLSSP